MMSSNDRGFSRRSTTSISFLERSDNLRGRTRVRSGRLPAAASAMRRASSAGAISSLGDRASMSRRSSPSSISISTPKSTSASADGLAERSESTKYRSRSDCVPGDSVAVDELR
eukprot:scaffold7366_cov254-Pinguiococcus_pyrenoidosus.AAC.15